ncbi:hypothetical protein GQ600_2416 [Phytophthora cactorum]|nr:hypothetical protein GQ600_2416 [Phytophthora cactorum]
MALHYFSKVRISQVFGGDLFAVRGSLGWGFAIWWTVLLVVHLLTGGYNAAFALFYHELRHTYLYMCLDYSGIGMPAENHEVISLVNAVMAAIQAASCCDDWRFDLRRELVFSPWDLTKAKSTRLANSTRPTKRQG